MSRPVLKPPVKVSGGETLDDSEAAGIIVKLVLVAVFLGVGLWGINQVATANYTANPIQALQQQVGGMLAVGIGWTLLLVLLGAAGAVAVVVRFILDLFDSARGL